MVNKKNILGNILQDFLERSLALKFDVCKCSQCKEKMMDYLLTKFEPVYVDEDNPDYKTIERKLFFKYFKDMAVEVKNVIDIVSKNMPHPRDTDPEKTFDMILEYIKKARGVDFSQYHREILKRRIGSRVIAHKVNSYQEYLKVLVDNPKEFDKLVDTLTINVSEFFRDPPVWEVIKKILGKVIDKKNTRGEPVKIWSAGCAKGEEPYSLAILAKEINNIKVPFKIYATDIDKESLVYAKEGGYDASYLELTMKNMVKESFFVNLPDYFVFKDGKYYIKREIKELVEFSYLDLTSSEYLSGVDMILCRNVFIYFTKPLQERIVDNFYRSLNEDGYLVIGMTETLLQESRIVFREVDNYNRIYQRIRIE